MKPTGRPRNPCFSSGPCAKRPGWSAAALEAALVGRSHRSGIGKARIVEVVDRSRAILGVPADWQVGRRRRLGYRCDRNRDVVAVGRARRRHARLGEFRRGLGRGRQAAEAVRCPGSARALWPAARPAPSRLGARRGLPVERHYLGRAGAGRRLDRRRPRGARDLRRDLGRVCDAAAMGQARCRHLVVAESAWRRGGARHAGIVAARGRAARKPYSAVAAAKALPADREAAN